MISLDNKKVDRLLNNSIIKFFNKLLVKQIFLLIFITTLLFSIIVDNVAPEKLDLKIGDIAKQDIIATKDIVDEKETEKLKQDAMEKVEPRHKIDPSVQVKIKNEIKKFFEAIYDVRSNKSLSAEVKIEIVKQRIPVTVSSVNIITALKTPEEDLEALESNIYDILGQIMSTGITKEEIEYEKENIKDIFGNLDTLSDDLKNLGVSLINNTIKPNRFLDTETTQQKKKEAASKVEPVVIKKGQLIVSKGDKIDIRKLELLRKSGLLKEGKGLDYGLTIGVLLLVLLLEGIVVAYLYVFDKHVLNSFKSLVILIIIILSTVVISENVNSISGYPEYLLPVSAATMLIAILLDAKLAIIVNFILSIIIGLVTVNDVNVIVMYLVGGIVGAIGVLKTHQRYNILLTGLLVSAINIITIVAFGLIGNSDIHIIISKCIYGLLNGIFSAILTIGSLPLWESGFGIVTPLKLLELSNPNHPLMKRLLLEAPGTYHHSILVANLSESAAEAVGGNALVARVGAYYHDVGKLKRPYFFKENQMNGENPHDKLNPSLSTLIITNHAKDGFEIAKKYRLPNVIKDIIEQHHGDTLVAYFYHKAINGENSENVQEDNFRYPGPRPQFKEAAIVMLADSVEAAVRSMQNPTRGKIEGLVRQIIKDKLNDGQLDECDLTLRDLDTIANSFLNILFGIFHERIEYPKLDLKELKGGK
ncbi:HD family phosphohydrolase [Caldisalinibacter kiritimatiensis]|uniref:Membrane protein n=1 Tax=Caldisalinibacter kiritimatiensis TaxID=1304284 RepID=R1AXF3_9FIRM|nr:HDIG domain-containing metalloprotein [Caldisalinibacter kiritimatiensis]EOD01878.1 Membrane protein [Caldisalinibacter kiritimatiensis]